MDRQNLTFISIDFCSSHKLLHWPTPKQWNAHITCRKIKGFTHNRTGFHYCQCLETPFSPPLLCHLWIYFTVQKLYYTCHWVFLFCKHLSLAYAGALECGHWNASNRHKEISGLTNHWRGIHCSQGVPLRHFALSHVIYIISYHTELYCNAIEYFCSSNNLHYWSTQALECRLWNECTRHTEIRGLTNETNPLQSILNTNKTAVVSTLACSTVLFPLSFTLTTTALRHVGDQ